MYPTARCGSPQRARDRHDLQRAAVRSARGNRLAVRRSHTRRRDGAQAHRPVGDASPAASVRVIASSRARQRTAERSIAAEHRRSMTTAPFDQRQRAIVRRVA
jgi:hypothetical protein